MSSLPTLSDEYKEFSSVAFGAGFLVSYLSPVGNSFHNVGIQKIITLPDAPSYIRPIERLMWTLRTFLEKNKRMMDDSAYCAWVMQDAGDLTRALVHTTPNRQSIDGQIVRICNNHVLQEVPEWERESTQDIGARIVDAVHRYEQDPEYSQRLKSEDPLVEFTLILEALQNRRPSQAGHATPQRYQNP